MKKIREPKADDLENQLHDLKLKIQFYKGPDVAFVMESGELMEAIKLLALAKLQLISYMENSNQGILREVGDFIERSRKILENIASRVRQSKSVKNKNTHH